MVYRRVCTLPLIAVLALLVPNLDAIGQEVIESQTSEAQEGPVGLTGSTSPTPVGASTHEQEYLIGPGDLLDVSVFMVKEFTRITARVGSAGEISLPLLGKMRATGKTSTDLESEIARRLSEKYIRDPHVTVFIKKYENRGIAVVGAVAKPGVYQLTGPTKLLDSLALARGLGNKNSNPAGSTVTVTRVGGFPDLQPSEGVEFITSEKVSINLRDLLYALHEVPNLSLQPRDVISVSEADIVYVVGEVKRPGGFVLKNQEQMSVLQAVALANGLSRRAAKGSARVIRRYEDGSKQEIPVNLAKILKGKEPDMILAANDILFIPDSGGKNAVLKGADVAVRIATGILIYRGRGR